MKLIVGLGNPGLRYARTRHNAGFNVVKRLAADSRVSLKRDKYTFSLSGQCTWSGERAILALPMTFMNVSGLAVAALLKRHEAAPKDMLVVCDDLDLEVGRIRIRAKGASGGQRGVESIIATISSQEFARLRVGIGRPPYGVEAADYVLMPVPRKDAKSMEDAFTRAAECCKMWVAAGVEQCMNEYNKGLPPIV